jgi:tetratricopeptide (TPR) repeat protein
MNSPRERRIDPALEELLTELSGHPQSTLLRVPVASGALNAPHAGARAANLLAAERELLSVFRYELRDLLLEACRRELYHLSGLQVSRWRSWGARIQISSEEAWRTDARRALDDVPNEVEARDALTLLSACVVHPHSPAPTVSQFAQAAQRVLLDDRARVYVALELISEESSRAAMSLLHGVLDDEPDTGVRSYCWQNLGVCHHRLGDLRAALQSYERALEDGEGRPGPLLSAFSLSLAVEETDRASYFAGELEDRMGVDHPGLDEELELLLNTTASEDAAASAARNNTYQVIEDRLGPVSRRIGNALAR